MLKMSSNGINSHMLMYAPLNWIVDYALFQSIPDIDQTLLEFIDVIHFHLVDSLLDFSKNFAQSHLDCWGSRLTKNKCAKLPAHKADCLTCSEACYCSMYVPWFYFHPETNNYQVRSPQLQHIHAINSDNGNWHNLNIQVSQSSVAMCLRYGGKCGDSLLQSPTVKKVWKLAANSQSYEWMTRAHVACFVLTQGISSVFYTMHMHNFNCNIHSDTCEPSPSTAMSHNSLIQLLFLSTQQTMC